MFVVLGADDARLPAAAADLVEVGASDAAPAHRALGASLWLCSGAAYFLIPLLATLLFSLRSDQTGKCCTLANYGYDPPRPAVLEDDQARFILALETIAITLAAARPDRLLGAPEAAAPAPADRLPRARPVRRRRRSSSSSACSTSTGARRSGSTREPYGFLVAAYVILAFPYMYFSLDTGFRSIDVHTLTEASQSLGAGWPTTLLRVILPNISAAALAGSFLTLAIVMGEFTIASLAAVQHVPGLHPVHQPEQGVPGRGGDAAQLRDHLGGDARPAARRPRAPRCQVGGAR